MVKLNQLQLGDRIKLTGKHGSKFEFIGTVIWRDGHLFLKNERAGGHEGYPLFPEQEKFFVLEHV